MKRVYPYLSLLIFVLFCHVGRSQYYHFEMQTATYESIANPDFMVSDSAAIDTVTAIMHSVFPNLNVQAFGDKITGIIESGKSGYIAALGDSADFIFDPFFSSLRSNGQSVFQSSEALIGSDSVLIMEWKNFGLENHPNSDFITFKAHLYLTTEIIEFHYGPSNLTVPGFAVGPFVTLIHADKGFGSYKEQMWLTGDPANPNISSQIGYLSDFPTNGTIYRFVGQSALNVEHIESKSIMLEVYPNPVSDVLFIRSDEQINSVELIDSFGRSIHHSSEPSNQVNIDIKQFAAGMITIVVKFKDGSTKQQQVVID